MTDPTFEGRESDPGHQFGPPLPPDFQVESEPTFKDTFPNPYQRETVVGQEFELPQPLDTEHGIGSYTVEYGELPPRSFSVQRFREGTNLPVEVAQWLRYRSFTDNRIVTQTSDDLYRFGDLGAAQRRFLRDQGGRRLYCAVDQSTGELTGAVWLHAIVGTGAGASVLRACVEYNNGKAEDPEKQINPARMATLASRIYGEDNRGKRIHTPLLLMALADYKQRWPECEGVMIRMSKGDARAASAFESQRLADQNARFEPVVEIEGAVFLLNRGLISAEDIEPYNPRLTHFE